MSGLLDRNPIADKSSEEVKALMQEIADLQKMADAETNEHRKAKIVDKIQMLYKTAEEIETDWLHDPTRHVAG